MRPWDIIQELESDNSRLKKEAIIKRESDADNIEFFNGVGAALDGFRTFGVQKVPVAKADGEGLTQSEFDDVLRELEARTLTGNQMRDVIQGLCDKSKVNQWNNWYRRILIKDLRCGVTHKTINKHSTMKVPVFECMLADDSKKHEKKMVGEVTRITLNNLTMMHHPMHLHGHYFRVINENGERSPLKHTVNVPPMQKVVIEFYNEEYGDWFFHCHVLYHMMGGMARVFSYDTPRDERMKPYPVQKLIDETDLYYSWGLARAGSNFNELFLTSSNIRNEFSLRAEFDYSQNAEIEVNYNRYLNDWVRVYAGVNTETSTPDSYDTFNTVGLVGVKYFTPYRFNVDVSMDHQLRPRIRLDRELLLFPRLFIEGEYEYRADFGWVNDLENNKSYQGETQWLVGVSYILSINFSIQGNYNNRYGWGGGLLVRF